MPGALTLTTPAHLLHKLKYGLSRLYGDQMNSYVAIDVLRDAYHLREWLWHGKLQDNAAIQYAPFAGHTHTPARCTAPAV